MWQTNSNSVTIQFQKFGSVNAIDVTFNAHRVNANSIHIQTESSVKRPLVGAGKALAVACHLAEVAYTMTRQV